MSYFSIDLSQQHTVPDVSMRRLAPDIRIWSGTDGEGSHLGGVRGSRRYWEELEARGGELASWQQAGIGVRPGGLAIGLHILGITNPRCSFLCRHCCRRSPRGSVLNLYRPFAEVLALRAVEAAMKQCDQYETLPLLQGTIGGEHTCLELSNEHLLHRVDLLRTRG